jgi:hypothetical protein
MIRVATLATPSTIGWREIEVVRDETAPQPSAACPATAAALPSGQAIRAEARGGATAPELAIDANEATGWEPGAPYPSTGSRGWIRLYYGTEALVSEVRVLLGPGAASARYEVALFAGSADGSSLGDLSPVSPDGGWATAKVDGPCVAADSVYVHVYSKEPAGSIREIRVVGTAAP